MFSREKAQKLKNPTHCFSIFFFFVNDLWILHLFWIYINVHFKTEILCLRLSVQITTELYCFPQFPYDWIKLQLASFQKQEIHSVNVRETKGEAFTESQIKYTVRLSGHTQAIQEHKLTVAAIEV